MKISDIFKHNSVQTQYSSGTKETKEARDEKNANALVPNNVAGIDGEDQIQISDLARQLAQLKRILNDDTTERQNRIQTLKEQIEKGEYNVSSNDLAQSVVAFVKDE